MLKRILGTQSCCQVKNILQILLEREYLHVQFVMLRLDLVMVRRMLDRLLVDKQQTVLTARAVDLTLTELILAVAQPMYFVVVVEHCEYDKNIKNF